MSDRDHNDTNQPPNEQNTLIAGISGSNVSYLPGDTIDGAYKLLKLLGRGGMGAVFSCVHLTLNNNYAIKVLSAENLTGEAWARFQQEAKTLAKLNHPGIVGIHNMGIDKEQCPYYVMDLLPGETLDATIKKHGRLPVNRSLEIFIHVAEALGSAHAQGVVHRDIKPSNLILTNDPVTNRTVVKLVDFGIARVQKRDSAGQSQTATGLIFGTPYYMSPEQCEGERADERSDVYSFGCALFEALTGRPPFVGDSAFQTFMLHQTQPAPTLASVAPDQEFPAALETAVQKMLKKKREARYQSMSQVKHDLERIHAGKSIMGQTNAQLTPFTPETRYKPEGGSAHGDDSHHEKEVKDKNTRLLVSLSIAAIAFVLVAAGIGSYIMFSDMIKKSAKKSIVAAPLEPAKTPVKLPVKTVDDDDSEESSVEPGSLSNSDPNLYRRLRNMGATEKETSVINLATNTKVVSEKMEFEEKLKALVSDSTWMAQTFKSNGVFHFPKDFIIGHISIDGKPPVPACGDISAGSGRSAIFYFLTPNRPYPQLLGKFGPNDLTGVSMVFDNAAKTIGTLSNWQRLEEVDYFNPILKSMPDGTEDWDESLMNDADAVALNRLKTVKTLGLCLPVSADAILKLPIVARINCLKVKRIANIETLLKRLKYYDNLTELWLVHQDTEDYQVGYLARMNNLKRLVIRRSHLTPDCYKEFSQMDKLRYLRLDRNDWTKAQKDRLQKNLPNCTIEYEPVVEIKYWGMFPANHTLKHPNFRLGPDF